MSIKVSVIVLGAVAALVAGCGREPCEGTPQVGAAPFVHAEVIPSGGAVCREIDGRNVTVEWAFDEDVNRMVEIHQRLEAAGWVRTQQTSPDREDGVTRTISSWELGTEGLHVDVFQDDELVTAFYSMRRSRDGTL